MASSTRIFGNCCRALRAAAKTSAATATATVTKARGRPNGILKPQAVSPALGKFLGTKEASRTDAVKKVWEYIKTHNLQVIAACDGVLHICYSCLQGPAIGCSAEHCTKTLKRDFSFSVEPASVNLTR